MLPRLVISQLLKALRNEDLMRIGGKHLLLQVFWTKLAWKISPWILGISMMLSWFAFRWMIVLLIPLLGIAYFINSFQGIRKGNPWGTALPLVLGLAWAGITRFHDFFALFFLAFTASLFVNRLGWWSAGIIAQKYPQLLGQMNSGFSGFNGGFTSNYAPAQDSDGISEAEVVEISDVEPKNPAFPRLDEKN